MKRLVLSSTNGTAALFGGLDENIIKVERAFGVNVVNRGAELLIEGGERGENKAYDAFERVIKLTERGEVVTEQAVNYIIAALEDDAFDASELDKLPDDVVCLAVSGKPVKPKTMGQRLYVKAIRETTIAFGVGPAGTGKTYLAMAAAVSAFKKNEVTRIVLTRPAIEAGEKLGFLPGDLQQKVDPYLRPLYDALRDIMGAEALARYLDKGLVEVAPLAYMRGRTLDNSFIVLDEAQNTTREQMKMFLTRVGFGSKVVVTGDLTQIDLPDGKKSGLVEAVDILKGIEDIAVCRLTARDVVRHPLVAKIIAAYEKTGNKVIKTTNERRIVRRYEYDKKDKNRKKVTG